MDCRRDIGMIGESEEISLQVGRTQDVHRDNLSQTRSDGLG